MARILILVENLSVPFDRRVWQESQALVEAGHEVAVICPRGAKRDTEAYALIEGVEIYRYPLEAATGEQNLEAKTALQEWAMARALPLPCYSVISRAGPDHAPVFTVEVSVQGCPPATANGSSLREAEKAAAQVLLTREGVS